jgi:hypothetical protein
MPHEADTAAKLRELEEQLLQPDVRSSPDRVASLLSEDFEEFGSSGRVFDKAQIVAGLAAERSPVLRIARDLRVRVLAEGVALVTYRAVRRQPDGSEASSLRSSVWTVADGRWRMAFHQGTPLPQGS